MMPRQLSAADEEQQKKREEEDKAWKKAVAEYHLTNLGLATWTRIDKRKPEDPPPTTLTVNGLVGPGDRILLGDGVYRRNPPYTAKHWWRSDDKYEIEIRVKNGMSWPNPIHVNTFRGVHMDALKASQEANMDFWRGEGASTILLSMQSHDHHGHAHHIEYGSDYRRKIDELKFLIERAEKKDVGIAYNDTLEKFFDDSVACKRMTAEERQWWFDKRDQLAVNPEGGIRAIEFKNILDKNFPDAQEAARRVNDLAKVDPTVADQVAEQARVDRENAAIRARNYSAYLDGARSVDDRLTAINNDLSKLEEKRKSLDEARKKIDKSIDKFTVATKGLNPEVIDFARIEKQQQLSQPERDNLTKAMLDIRNDMENQITAMREALVKVREEINTTRQEVDKEKPEVQRIRKQLEDEKAAGLNDQEYGKRNREVSERENRLQQKEAKVAELEKKMPEQTAKLEATTKSLQEVTTHLTATKTHSDNLARDIQERKEENDKVLASRPKRK